MQLKLSEKLHCDSLNDAIDRFSLESLHWLGSRQQSFIFHLSAFDDVNARFIYMICVVKHSLSTENRFEHFESGST